MRVLLFCDDQHHPGDVPANGVEPLKEKGITVDVIQNPKDFCPSTLENYNAVIMSKCDHVTMENHESWKTDAIQDAFIQYVENGGGLIVTHSGTVAGKNTGKLDRLIGCKFKSHPAQVPVTVQPIKPHPITEGVEMFVETDEHYHLEILAPDIDIIAASYAPAQGDPEKYGTEHWYFNAPANISPAVYVRTQGNGRVCMLAPGHNLEVWLNPQFQRMLENALYWCCGEK